MRCLTGSLLLVTACSTHPGYQFKTDHGLYVEYLGKDNCPERAMVEAWTEQAAARWMPYIPRLLSLGAVRGVQVWFTDHAYFECPPGGREVFACTNGQGIAVGKVHPQNLFIHELSHVIALKAGGLGWDESLHHWVFRQLGID